MMPVVGNRAAIQLAFSRPAVIIHHLPITALLLHCIRDLAKIPNYLVMELRYMGARGMRLKQIHVGP
jgi:hypothetical protein